MRSKRLIALMLTIVMALAMSATAFATVQQPPVDMNEKGGEAGNFADGGDETELTVQQKQVVIYKQLIAYNPDVSEVNAPAVTYNYAITPATVNSYTVIDGQNPAVTADVKAGVGTPGITASVALTNATPLETASAGKENNFPITIDFSGVVFGSAGVYRYEIAETVEGIAATGITAGTSARKRYMDVYVKANANCGDGTAAADWDIYGYTCFVVNDSIESTTKASAAKTIGFGSYTLASTDGSTDYTADSYYTYNLQIGKTVVGDNYAEKNTLFPFTVTFTNSTVTGSIDISSTTSGTVSGFTDPAAGVLSSTSGDAEIKSGGSIKYIGIPCGTSVQVYETNVATGVTYEVTTAVSTSTDTPTPESVASGATSTAVTVSAPANAAFTSLITIDIENKYLTISPTGVIVRYAPYALVLICGILLLLLGWKFLRRKETA